ncbi:MAG: response regulator receiver protein [Massilia sp.]|jgi:FixJ family two-component response regulator|nr:response regulator receiver protein [Massilia sp.]MDB5952330.1 response regulator receiver protein [Massilia sp.]
MRIAGDQMLVAIVDDEAALREATESLLKSAGFDARSFGSAEDWLRSAQRDQFGCLVLDVTLPGMSGLELQRHLAWSGCQLPIVFMTANEDHDGRMAQALRANAVAFLQKPFCGEDLLSAVQSAFGTRT